MLDVGLVLEEQVDDVAMTLPAGEGQRDVVLTTRRYVDPCTVEEKKLGHREMAFPEEGERGRERERGESVRNFKK